VLRTYDFSPAGTDGVGLEADVNETINHHMELLQRVRELETKLETAASAYSDLLNNSVNEVRKLETENAALKATLRKRDGELQIKTDFLRSRQCPDHSGKWERCRCLQCELETAQATLARVEALPPVEVEVLETFENGSQFGGSYVMKDAVLKEHIEQALKGGNE